MPRKKKKMYFDEVVQHAIVEYNNESAPHIRNKIYSERIAYAFDKLVENIINTFKFSYFDSHFNDTKNEVVSFLVLNIHKYNPDRGFKAFSYFSVVAKNYLIVLNNNNYKKLKSHSCIHDMTDFDKNPNYIQTINSPSHDANKELLSEMVQFFEKSIPKMFKKQNDIAIAYSIIELMREDTLNMIENFTKKGIYILIREMTGEPTSRITKVLNQLKKKYFRLKTEFDSTGTLRKTTKY